MMKKILVLALLLVAGVCHAETEETGSLMISMGADLVMTFEPEYVPTTDYCYGFTVTGHPNKVFVSPVYPGIKRPSEYGQGGKNLFGPPRVCCLAISPKRASL